MTVQMPRINRTTADVAVAHRALARRRAVVEARLLGNAPVRQDRSMSGAPGDEDRQLRNRSDARAINLGAPAQHRSVGDSRSGNCRRARVQARTEGNGAAGDLPARRDRGPGAARILIGCRLRANVRNSPVLAVPVPPIGLGIATSGRPSPRTAVSRPRASARAGVPRPVNKVRLRVLNSGRGPLHPPVDHQHDQQGLAREPTPAPSPWSRPETALPPNQNIYITSFSVRGSTPLI